MRSAVLSPLAAYLLASQFVVAVAAPLAANPPPFRPFNIPAAPAEPDVEDETEEKAER